jgi:hypothetical protein
MDNPTPFCIFGFLPNHMRVIILLILTLFTFCAFAQTPKSDWNQLKPGMSAVDVKKWIGEPQKIESFYTIPFQTTDTSFYWRYDGGKVVIIKNHMLERIETDRNALLRNIQQKAFKQTKDGLIIVPYGSK